MIEFFSGVAIGAVIGAVATFYILKKVLRGSAQ
jgi:gas vesicle protein